MGIFPKSGTPIIKKLFECLQGILELGETVADEQADLEVEVVYNSDIKYWISTYVYPGLATDYFLRSHPQYLEVYSK